MRPEPYKVQGSPALHVVQGGFRDGEWGPWELVLSLCLPMSPGESNHVYNETDYILDMQCFPGLEFTQNWLGRSAPPLGGEFSRRTFQE
jgi:hypothetical protein